MPKKLSLLDLRNYTRWFTASILKEIDEHRQDVPLYVEGQERQTQNVPAWIEARIDGPLQRPSGSFDDWTFELEIDLLCSTKFDSNYIYKPQELLGIGAYLLTRDFRVYKLGDKPGDDQSFLGLLQLQGKLTGVHNFTFGQIEETTKIIQGTVHGNYKMYT